MKRIVLAWAAARLILAALCLANGTLDYEPRTETAWYTAADESFRYQRVENRFLDPTHRNDAQAYLSIAHFGYDAVQTDKSNTAFFPGYPWIAKGIYSGLAGLRSELDGSWKALFHVMHLVSALLYLGALLVLHRWMKDVIGPEAAVRGIVLLICFPSSFVFFCGLSESSFLFVTILAFSTASRGRWWAAGPLAAFGAIVRSVGATAILPLVLLALEKRRWRLWPLPLGPLWLFLVPMALVALLLHVGEANGNAFAYYDNQRARFGHGHFPTLQGVFDLFLLTRDGETKAWAHILRDILQIASLAFATVGTVWLIRERRRVYSVIPACVLGSLLIVIPALSDSLISLPRYALVVFPAFAGFAMKFDGRRFLIVAVACAVLQAACWMAWIHNWPIVI